MEFFILFRFLVNHKKEMEIQAAIEAKHGIQPAELS
jgi:hypothetical protein